MIHFFAPSLLFAKTVHYELVIKNEKVNISGKKEVDFALTVNGGIPAPTLEFTEGDDAEILVKNALPNEEVSLHWHGILLPPEEDGVAYVNTPPIFSGKSRLFKFKIRQHGTYWYHSHTMLQEQKGVYGAILIHPKKKTLKYDRDFVVVLSDWSDENADQILRNIKKDGDYYLAKKNSVRSWMGAVKSGTLKTYLKAEWDRMGAMDLSDVGYDAFLVNGKKDFEFLSARPNEKIRIRVINAAASSYFFVSLAGIPMKVIAADGNDIKPIFAKELLMGMAETYDILFTMPDYNKKFELRATAQDVTGSASAWIGKGEKVFSKDKPHPDLYASMDHSNHGTSGHQNHQQHEHHEHMNHEMHSNSEEAALTVETLTVENLKSLSPTVNPKAAKTHDVKLELDGDMERYVWSINGKGIHEERTIEIKEGDVVRFNFVNNTMMHHPMHLHGHFFRVLNKNDEYSPLKHTVDVPPNGQRTIEFYANEPGQWMLHCHNLYHMKTGMARIVKYSSFTPSAEMAMHEKHDPHMHEHWYFYGKAAASTNQVGLNLRTSQTRNEFSLRAESTKSGSESFSTVGSWHDEGDLIYRRWADNYLNYVIGGTSYEKESYGIIGVGYKLPLLIHSNFLVNNKGKIRIDLEKHFQWTTSLFSEVEVFWRPQWGEDEETEIKSTLMYGPGWSWAAGLTLTKDSIGAGAQLRF